MISKTSRKNPQSPKVLKKSVKLLVLAVIVMLMACNAFSPRDSEEPESGVEWNSFPIQPQQVLENLVYAYEFSQNSIKYGEIFTDEFRFFFDTQDVSDYGVPQEWDAQTESDMLLLLYNHLLSNTDMTLELEEVEDEPDDIQSEFAEFYRKYTLSVQHDLNHLPQTFSGVCFLEIVKGTDGFWRISQWQDNRKDQESVTWGRLKYEVSP